MIVHTFYELFSNSFIKHRGSNQLLYLFINFVRKMIVGVLAVQGSFAEHMQVLQGLVEEVKLVRRLKDLEGVSGLVIPGGESTTIGDFLEKQRLAQSIKDNLPIFGTCAGLIVLAKNLVGKQKEGQGLLKRMEIEVERNAYGRQMESFEDQICLTWSDKSYNGVFIRAPKIMKYSSKVEVLGWHDTAPVMIRQDKTLACAFHPELTDDARIHRYFIEEVVTTEGKIEVPNK
jgi:5'-phosphate synthase pdxT subunit